MKYTLHHAPLVLDGDIPTVEFDSLDGLTQYITEKWQESEAPRVYVFSYESKGDFETDCEVLVTTDLISITTFLDSENYQKNLKLKEFESYFLQEFYSYDEAYKIALGFKEGLSDLCYEPETTD